MLQNYLKLALRNAVKFPGYTALNLSGLVVGVSTAILIALWVYDEVQVDQFHDNSDRIFQVFRNMQESEGVVHTTQSIPKPVGDLLREEYPEIDQVAFMSWEMEARLDAGNQEAFTEEGLYVDTEFIKMFSFDLLLGDKDEALKDPNSMMISEALALRHFGADWRSTAIGHSIRVDDEHDAIISAVFENPGRHSSLQFDYLIPASHFINENAWVNNWGNGSFSVFFTLNNSEDIEVVSDRLFDEITAHTSENNQAGEETLITHKFADTYLHSKFDNGVVSGGRIEYVKIMTIVAVFLVLIAAINFMNLATARSGRRAREIGVRKVLGAFRHSLSTQFFIEALLMSTLSVVLSVLVVVVTLPYFNQLVGKSISVDFGAWATWLIFFGLILILGLISGSYPALVMPRFSIANALKGTVRQVGGAVYFRKVLVVFQFAITMILLIGTAVIYFQMEYVLHKDLGLDKENLLMVRMHGDLAGRLDTYKNELLNIPEVVSVTATSGNPINYGRSTSSASWEGKNPSQGYEINVILSDKDLVKTCGMTIATGRDFSHTMNDSTNFLINETAAELMGFENPIGKSLSFWGIDGQIIGVVKNFHMRDMYRPIAPLIISCIDPSRSGLALLRIQGNQPSAIASIGEVTMSMNPAFDFEYDFVSNAYAENYQNELTISTLARVFAIISIFIACLGLLGLSAFTAEQRSKEIGIRRVHGASVSQLVVLLSTDYSKLIIIALVISTPVAFYYAQQWLGHFKFSMSLNPFLFFAAGLCIFIVGAITVGYKSLQAARMNPVDTLKDE